MSRHQRAPVVALTTLLRRRFPDLPHSDAVIRRGLVLVNEAPVSNPRARVRANASVRLLGDAPLRGTIKLTHALRAFGLDVTGLSALDLGAAAGGFTQALLDAGARRVYAVDAGVGQLRGTLRGDSRVANMERTNLSQLSRLPEVVDIVTMDLSYLPIADALPEINHRLLAPEAHLVALVKPTFELRAGTLAARSKDIANAVLKVKNALGDNGWQFLNQTPSPIRGANGAVETFVLARHKFHSSITAHMSAHPR